VEGDLGGGRWGGVHANVWAGGSVENARIPAERTPHDMTHYPPPPTGGTLKIHGVGGRGGSGGGDDFEDWLAEREKQVQQHPLEQQQVEVLCVCVCVWVCVCLFRCVCDVL